MLRHFALIAIVLTASIAHAQIEMKDSYVMGEPIEVRFKVVGADVKDVDIDYVLSPGQVSRPIDGTLDLYVWVAKPGTYTVDAAGAAIIDGKPKAKKFKHTYTVIPAGDDPIPEPPASLRSLVNDAEAIKLISILAAQLDQVKAGQFTSLDMWKAICTERFKANGIDNAKAVARIFAMNADFAKLATSLEGTIKELGGSPAVPAPSTQIKAITYIFDKSKTAPPPGVVKGLDRLNREKKIKATMLEDPSNNENGRVAKQYERALAAAKSAGMPVAVVEYTDGSTKTVADPRTDEQMWSLAP